MAYTVLKAVSERLGTRWCTHKPRTEKTRVRPHGFPTEERTDIKSVIFHRELSLGCFSETNQKRLTRDSPIEIYRARLPGNIRLVVSRCLGNLDVDGPDASTSIILMSPTSLVKTCGCCSLPDFCNSSAFIGQDETQGSVTMHFSGLHLELNLK